MRRFYVENEYGERVQLQGGDVFFYAPEGLGYEDDVEYMTAEGFYIPVTKKPAQVPVQGSLIFVPDNAYDNYKSFFDWVLQAQNLVLAYKPTDTWYYVRIHVQNVEKSELTTMRHLEVPVTFMPLSPYYTPQNMNISIEGADAYNNKTYTYSYPYRYANTNIAGQVEFIVNAQIDCDFKLTLKGAISAPIVTIRRLDTNAVVGKVDLSAMSAQLGESLVFSTVVGESGVKLITPDGVQDMTTFIGFTAYDTFFRIPANVRCRMELEATSLIGTSATLQVFRYFRTV